jgi:DNA-binding response OmpR family regulator
MLLGGTPRSVLLVEDDSRLRDLYRLALTEAGFTVVAVGDGIDALHVLEQRVPTAVVLDLALPRLSGRDVGQELKSSARTRHIPIVVVTGTDGGDVEGLDVDCVLRKPILPERLVEAVDLCTRKTIASPT